MHILIHLNGLVYTLKCRALFSLKQNWILHISGLSRIKVSSWCFSFCFLVLLQTFSCTICPSVFKRKQEFRLHMISHTGDMPNKVSTPFDYYICDQWSLMIFYNVILCESIKRPNLWYLIPTKSPYSAHPFQCTSCPEQFMQKRDLTMHLIKIHGFAKPHAVGYTPHVVACCSLYEHFT